jgi:chromosome segregation ATPase
MEEMLREELPVDGWRESFAQTIDERRRRAAERVASHRGRLKDLDTRLAAQIDEAVQALTHEQQQAQTSVAQVEAKAGTLDERKRQLDAKQAELDKLQADLAGKLAAEVERQKDFKRREAELAAARQAHDSEFHKVKAQADATRQLESSLKLKEQQLIEREEQTKRQRKNASQQLRARKNELTAEAELNRVQAAASGAGQDMQLQLRLSELQGKYDHLRGEFDAREAHRDESTQKLAELKAQLELRQHDLGHQQSALAESQKRQAELEAERTRLQTDLQKQLEELDRVRRESEQQVATARKEGGGSKVDTAELTKLREENKQLETLLAEAEERAKTAGPSGNQDLDDLRRRFEMAVQDVRELKTKNAELTEQLSKRPATIASSIGSGAGGSDWESMKKRLLADLDSDFDEANAGQKADKLTVQGAIKITDDVVAEKEREIQELRQMLDNQAQQVGEVAVGAAAVAQMLDSDELIRQEREALKRLQDNLREQLKAAEVDISVERARLARERAEVDEKIRGLEAEKANMPAGGDSSGDKSKKPGGRKWLARLGLGEGKEEK